METPLKKFKFSWCYPRSFITAIYVRRMRKDVRYCFDNKIMTSAVVEIRIAFLICYLQSLYEIELGHYFCPEFVGHVTNQNNLVDAGKLMQTNTNGYTMHEDGNNFPKLWMTTAENLSVEIRYQKLKVIIALSMAFSRIKFTIFFCTIFWVVSYSSFIVRFCFSSQNSFSFECL